MTAAALTRQVPEGRSSMRESPAEGGEPLYIVLLLLKVKRVCLLILVIGLFYLYGDP